MSGKITGRTKVRKRCQRGTSHQQRSWSWQTQVHSVILHQTTETQKTDCGDALKISTQSTCLSCPHPPKASSTPLVELRAKLKHKQSVGLLLRLWD